MNWFNLILWTEIAINLVTGAILIRANLKIGARYKKASKYYDEAEELMNKWSARVAEINNTNTAPVVVDATANTAPPNQPPHPTPSR